MMIMTLNSNCYILAQQNDNCGQQQSHFCNEKASAICIVWLFYDQRSKSKQFVRKLITLQMCSDLLVCKAVCQKIFTEVFLGLMVGGRRASTVLVQCRVVRGSPGLSLPEQVAVNTQSSTGSCRDVRDKEVSSSCEQSQPLFP